MQCILFFVLFAPLDSLRPMQGFETGHGAAISFAGAGADLAANRAWLFGDDGDDDAAEDANAGAVESPDHEDGPPPGFQVGFATAKGSAVQLDGAKMAGMNAWLFAGGGEDDEPLAAASSAAAPEPAARRPSAASTFQTAAQKVAKPRQGGDPLAAAPRPPTGPPGARQGLSRSAGPARPTGFKRPGPAAAKTAEDAAVGVPPARKPRFNAPRKPQPAPGQLAAPRQPLQATHGRAAPAPAAARYGGPTHCACANRKPLSERRCPSCCDHCGGRLEQAGIQVMHLPGCANDASGPLWAKAAS